MTSTHPPTVASRWSAGFAATLVGGVIAIGVAILWGVLTDNGAGQLAVLASSVLAAATVGVALVVNPRWRRFGAGLVAGSIALLTGYAALLFWIASQIGT